jgi:hypothetical protein
VSWHHAISAGASITPNAVVGGATASRLDVAVGRGRDVSRDRCPAIAGIAAEPPGGNVRANPFSPRPLERVAGVPGPKKVRDGGQAVTRQVLRDDDSLGPAVTAERDRLCGGALALELRGDRRQPCSSIGGGKNLGRSRGRPGRRAAPNLCVFGPGCRDEPIVAGRAAQQPDIALAARRSAAGTKAAYTLRVVEAFECPSRPATVRRSMPEVSSPVAAKCRRSCRRTPSRPARWHSRWKARLVESGRHGRRPSGSWLYTKAAASRATPAWVARCSARRRCASSTAQADPSSAIRRDWRVLVGASTQWPSTMMMVRTMSSWPSAASRSRQRSPHSSPRRRRWRPPGRRTLPDRGRCERPPAAGPPGPGWVVGSAG